MKTKADEVIAEAFRGIANLQAFAAESDAIVEQIKPLLAGKGSVIQGLVLAELAAVWVAGHVVEGDPEATRALQAEMLKIHQQTVTLLVTSQQREA
jgi:hypothetical protein